MDQELKREFDRLHREIKALKQEQAKATWVSCGWITSITGWDHEKLRQARDQGIVEFKRAKGSGILYKLQSIPEQFIKQKHLNP